MTSAWVADFVHHLKVALLVASAVTLLHGWGALGWLDAVMLNAVGGAPEWLADKPATDDLPVVLMVGSTLYEREFRQASPLDRSKLAQLIRQIPRGTDAGPTLLVIDIDLSPTPGDDAHRRAQQELDHALRDIVDAGTRLLLVLPARVTTDELQQLKFSWLKGICAWNDPGKPGKVAFALSEVPEHFGRVLQYAPGRLTLGSLAADFSRAEVFCRRVLGDPADSGLGRWGAAYVSALFDARVFNDLVRPGRLQSFNAHFFRSIDERLVVAETLDGTLKATDGTPLNLARRTLFLGGGYDEKDRFLTPLDPAGSKVEGVVVHAATFYSTTHPVRVSEGFPAFALDVVLGLLVGYLFACTWGWYRRAGQAAAHTFTASGYCAVRGLFVLNVGLLVALIAVCMTLATSYLYPYNLWVNPGPIILGVFVKFLLATRADGASHHAAGGTHSPGWQRWLDRTALGCIILAALWTAVYH